MEYSFILTQDTGMYFYGLFMRIWLCLVSLSSQWAFRLLHHPWCFFHRWKHRDRDRTTHSDRQQWHTASEIPASLSQYKGSFINFNKYMCVIILITKHLSGWLIACFTSAFVVNTEQQKDLGGSWGRLSWIWSVKKIIICCMVIIVTYIHKTFCCLKLNINILI